ncbi:hypothetical protein [Tropicibacter oceani]|uniref:Uncharacterized protein n=1 Tax=Tropicibacter oceani TaxID=3058420 RepID=A0ABY8QMW7_9RHOB|nr:hypothetical protein [Tropicibacter oceani]WGW05361.1 hypothetical protein QF118_07385 [Tropicibacter oceani]
MDSALQTFEKRQKALRRKHERMARGYVNKLDRNGLITQRPDSKLGGILFKLVMLVVLAIVVSKILLLAALGQEAYLTHLTNLQAGGTAEQAGAWLMQIDPVTAKVAEGVALILN